MISVCILTKNASRTLKKTLDSVQTFPEVIILDTGSKDATISIAKTYKNVTVYESSFSGFGELRNNLAELAKNNWILALDSDEVVSPPLLREIETLSLLEDTAYVVPRHNFYNNKRIYGCGWNPDFVARLYHRKQAKYSEAKVHESLQAKKKAFLKSPLLHTPYQSTEDFLNKMQHYSSLFAEQYRGKRKSSFTKALGHAAFAFFKSYLLKRGIFDGSAGFTISIYNANTAFYKYLKLMERNSSSIT